MRTYIATVDIAFTIEGDQTPEDAVSAMLSENLMSNGELIDWQYSKAVVLNYPYEIIHNENNLVEGGVF